MAKLERKFYVGYGIDMVKLEDKAMLQVISELLESAFTTTQVQMYSQLEVLGSPESTLVEDFTEINPDDRGLQMAACWLGGHFYCQTYAERGLAVVCLTTVEGMLDCSLLLTSLQNYFQAVSYVTEFAPTRLKDTGKLAWFELPVILAPEVRERMSKNLARILPLQKLISVSCLGASIVSVNADVTELLTAADERQLATFWLTHSVDTMFLLSEGYVVTHVDQDTQTTYFEVYARYDFDEVTVRKFAHPMGVTFEKCGIRF